MLDSNVGVPSQRIEDNTFESNLEDFYAICDQIEANLKCALEVRAAIDLAQGERMKSEYEQIA